MVCCLPGARVRDVSERLQDLLKGEGEQPEVVIHIGTNDIGRKSDEILKYEYKVREKAKVQDPEGSNF